MHQPFRVQSDPRPFPCCRVRRRQAPELELFHASHIRGSCSALPIKREVGVMKIRNLRVAAA